MTFFWQKPIVLLGLAFEGSLVLVAWGLGWLLEQPTFATIRLDWIGLGLGVLASLPMLALFVATIRWPVGPLARIEWITEALLRPLFLPCTLLELAAISVLAGLGEELLFRAVLQGWVERWLGPLAGLLLASTLFGLLHPLSREYALMAAGMGAYLGGCWLTAGNLLVPITAHALYDFLALVYITRVHRGKGESAANPDDPMLVEPQPGD
jgi:hypothetical protein